MVGLQIFVEFTDAEGKTYESDPTDPVYVYSFEIEEAKASKVNEITVTFANPVEAENVTFAVKKGTEDFPIEKVEATDWSLTEDEVTLKTSANMAKGTYTVTATDSVTKDTDSADFEVTKQEVAKIVIKNTEAYTNADDRADKAHTEAYAYYDVLDQYDQSIRSSASIQWAGSCEIKADKANGMLTLTKSGNDKKAWVYGEKIYITGVYTKTGAATSETLTVNTEQSLDTIEVVGFLKKGTSDIIEDLPEDFKTEAYYMLFHALDQNGCPLKADRIDREDVTFITDSPLVVKEVTFGEAGAANATDNKPFTVKGTEYNAVYVNPGINVAKGGQVNVTAIANKTGNKTDYNFWVGPDAVITSFDISSPSGVIADGDQGVEITFEAKTEDGTVITNFKQLAKQEIFNTLSFTTSEGMLKLAEQDDRSAKLTWSDEAKYAADSAWELSTSTDDIDRPVSLTAIVVGGEPDNEMLSVQDKRRPNSIAEVKLDDVYVEGAELPITLNTFKFYDQYGKLIGTTWGADNGFFAKAKAKLLKNTDFSAYTFGVRIEYAGTGKIAYTTGGGAVAESVDANGVIDGKKVVIQSGETANYSTTTNIKSVATGEGFKFDIAKFKDVTGKDVTEPGDWDSVSPSKYKPITVVDITQVKNLTIDDLNKFYVGGLKGTDAHAGDFVTGDKIIGSAVLNDFKDTPMKVAAVGTDGIYKAGSDYQQTVKVTGTFGSSKVTIPTDYYTIEANKLKDTDGDDKFDAIIPYAPVGDPNAAPNGLQAADLYDKTTAKGVSKDGNDEVTATVYKLYTDDESDGAYFWASDANGKFVKNEIPDGARSSTIATLRSESNATLTSTANITKAQTAASNAAKLAAVNEVLEGEGYTALTDNNGAYTDLTNFIAGNAPYNNRTGDKGATTSKSDAATKLTAATTALATAEATEEDAAAALGTANTNTAEGFVTALNTALTAEAAGTLTDQQVTDAAAVVDGADGSNTATEIMGAVNNNHMQITGDELRDAAIAYVTQKVAQLGTKATFEGTTMYSEAGNKAKADQLLTDAELKEMTDGEIDTAATTAIAAGTATETAGGDLATYLKAKKNNLIAIDTLNEKKDELNALKTGASATADGAAFTVTAGTTDAQIKALPYRANGLAPKEAAAATYLKAVRDRFKAQKAVTDAEKAYKAWVEEEAVTAAGTAWTASDDQKVADAFAALVAENNANPNGIPVAPVYDTAKKAITLSDQAPYAADIKGLKDSYTFKSAGTEVDAFYDATQDLDVYLKAAGGDLTVVDQYGVVMPNAVLEYTVSNAIEDKDGYAENNFKVSDNGTNDPSIVGAEIGDTFDLVISVAGSTLEKTTKVTVGADTWAAIENNDNKYTKKDGLKDVLEEQRKAGLQ